MENSKKLSIVALFCDKDCQYIPSLIKDLIQRLMCNYEIILVDNRDNYKEELPWLNDFLMLGNFTKYICSGKNMAQLAAKKKALDMCTGDYVWFFDADDIPADAVSQTMLDNCDEDIVCFNYGYIFTPRSVFDNCAVTYIENFTEPKAIDARKYRIIDEPLTKLCCTCWNKWFKRDLLTSFFNLIPEDKRISCNEDTWICSVALNRAKTIREDPHFIYLNFKERGFSNCDRITSLEAFKMIIQGWNEVHELYGLEFKKPCKIYDRTTHRRKDLGYLIRRIDACVPEVQQRAFKLLKEFLSNEELEALQNVVTYDFPKLRYLFSV